MSLDGIGCKSQKHRLLLTIDNQLKNRGLHRSQRGQIEQILASKQIISAVSLLISKKSLILHYVSSEIVGTYYLLYFSDEQPPQ